MQRVIWHKGLYAPKRRAVGRRDGGCFLGLPPSLRRIWNFLLEESNRVFTNAQWNIGILDEPIHTLLRSDVKPSIRWLPPPKEDTCLADPFALVRDGRVYILCEELDFRTWKGVISCIVWEEGRVVLGPHVVIDAPHHISYPFLFEHEGEVFCVPEMSRSGEVRLYKAEEFPTRWTKAATLIEDFPGIDPTVFQHRGRWWMTCTNASDGPDYRLYIWHASDLFGPWEPHAKNPVKEDLRSTRPGGTPFTHHGVLYRPAQDSTRTYGGQVVINRVVRLTTTQFEEEPAAIISPPSVGPYPDGIHTLSASGRITLVDGKRSMFIGRALKHSLRDALTTRWRDALRTRWLPR